MGEPHEIGPGVYQVAGPDMTDGRDAAAYLIEDAGRSALIDVGAGPSYSKIIGNIRALGLGPEQIRYAVATHAHIDHVGGLAALAAEYSPDIVVHQGDAEVLKSGDPVASAADWYNLPLSPATPTIVMKDRDLELPLNQSTLHFLHTPGHTPGSMVAWLDREGRRYLFGQDIHGPFDAAFGSNMLKWRDSMEKLIDLGADVLAEGHYGVIYGRDRVEDFIRGFIKQHLGSS